MAVRYMRVLGIDPGMTRLGYGGVNATGNTTELLQFGIIANPRDLAMTFNDHLDASIEQITLDFPKVIDLIKPTVIVSEMVPVGKLGSNDALVIAAIVVCKTVAAQFGIDWINIAASTAKKNLTGDGRATKTKVRNAVIDIFPKLAEAQAEEKKLQKQHSEKVTGLPQDIFDAIGVAYVGVEIVKARSKK